MSTHKPILSSSGNGPARRNLFGPVDREQLQAEYQAALRKDVEEASQRWGFDFISNKPLEGSDFQWEGIPVSSVPLHYRSCTLVQRPAEGQRVATAAPKGRRAGATSNKENIPCTPEKCAALVLDHLQKTPERSENTGLKRKQTNITDFYQAKRRVVWTPRKSGE